MAAFDPKSNQFENNRLSDPYGELLYYLDLSQSLIQQVIKHPFTTQKELEEILMSGKQLLKLMDHIKHSFSPNSFPHTQILFLQDKVLDHLLIPSIGLVHPGFSHHQAQELWGMLENTFETKGELQQEIDRLLPFLQ